MVFVITLLSLALQGTTITTAARWLGLATDEDKTGNDFGIELPDELESKLSELKLTEESLVGGNQLKDMHFPKGTLVMMVKRGNSYIVPNGQLELMIRMAVQFCYPLHVWSHRKVRRATCKIVY